MIGGQYFKCTNCGIVTNMPENKDVGPCNLSKTHNFVDFKQRRKSGQCNSCHYYVTIDATQTSCSLADCPMNILEIPVCATCSSPMIKSLPTTPGSTGTWRCPYLLDGWHMSAAAEGKKLSAPPLHASKSYASDSTPAPSPIDPPHYQGDYVMRIIEDFRLDFLDGQVIKYILRSGNKPSSTPLEDHQKAAWYLARKIKNLAPSKED